MGDHARLEVKRASIGPPIYVLAVPLALFLPLAALFFYISVGVVYAITNQGVRTLQKAGLVEEPTATDWNFQNRSLHDLSIHHTLLIAHIRTVLTAACNTSAGTRLLFWHESVLTTEAYL